MAKRAKKKSNNYFTKITEIAILAYNKSDSMVKREKVYRRFIYPAFMKLAENLINKIKSQRLEHANLPKFAIISENQIFVLFFF